MINGKTFYGLSENSRFDIYLAPMEAGGPYTLVLYSKQGKTTISDVLIGEVILCSGQSNMEWTVGNSIELGDQGLHGPDQMALAGGRYIPDPVRDPDTYSDWVSDSAEREEMIKNLYKTETQNYRNDKLRLFKVQITTPIIENADVYRGIAQTPQIDFIGSWKKAGPGFSSAENFASRQIFPWGSLCLRSGLLMRQLGSLGRRMKRLQILSVMWERMQTILGICLRGVIISISRLSADILSTAFYGCRGRGR